MNIHEFQAKQVLTRFEAPVPRGSMAETVEGAVTIAQQMFDSGATAVVVKAQIHAGGRGKAGGVKLCKSAEEAKAAAWEILGKVLVTPQTGPEGKKVRKLLIEEGAAIERELYLSITLDRGASMPVIIASAAGGMSIEEVAATNPEKITTVRVDPLLGLRDFQIKRLNAALGLTGDLAKQGYKLFGALFRLYLEMDCTLVEINPLVVTADGKLICLDAKLNFDDNALYRHADVAALRDPDEEAPLEVEAHNFNLNYIKLDGNVGCMVNGAGLAMSTMDLVQTVGLMPANFLDVGGGANQEMIENAFRILLSDPKVKGVLINIFGGILRCDVLAQGIVSASQKLDLHLPMVIRMEGTNVDQGKKILHDSGLNFTVGENFKDAAEKLKQVMKGVN
jgi:succinyl-CoA synthetase beta subunit